MEKSRAIENLKYVEFYRGTNMRDIKRKIIKGLWNFITDNCLTVVDAGDDLCIYMQPADLEHFAYFYIPDFEQRKPAVICPDGEVYIEASKLLAGDGITLEQFKNGRPEGFCLSENLEFRGGF